MSEFMIGFIVGMLVAYAAVLVGYFTATRR